MKYCISFSILKWEIIRYFKINFKVYWGDIDRVLPIWVLPILPIPIYRQYWQYLVIFVLRNGEFQTFFKMAAKRLTLKLKTIRTFFEDLSYSYTASQLEWKSEQKKLRNNVFFAIFVLRNWDFQIFFKMAAKRLTLKLKTIMTFLKVIHIATLQANQNENRSSRRWETMGFIIVPFKIVNFS